MFPECPFPDQQNNAIYCVFADLRWGSNVTHHNSSTQMNQMNVCSQESSRTMNTVLGPRPLRGPLPLPFDPAPRPEVVNGASLLTNNTALLYGGLRAEGGGGAQVWSSARQVGSGCLAGGQRGPGFGGRGLGLDGHFRRRNSSSLQVVLHG